MRHGRLSARSATALLTAALALAGCGGVQVLARDGHDAPPPREGDAHDGALADPAIDAAVGAWIAREASPEWAYAVLASIRCGDHVLAIVWPFGRAGHIDDDDVIALPLREGDLAVDGEPSTLRARGARLERCGPAATVMRVERGVARPEVGRELAMRFALARSALARSDAGAVRDAILLLAQLFDDEAVTSDAFADVVSDFARNGAELVSAEVRGDRLATTIRERPGREAREVLLELVPVPEGRDRVVIRLPSR